MSKFENLINKKFGKLIVVKRVENNKFNQAQWLCQCECGNELVINTNSLKSGNTKSCGCLAKNKNTYYTSINSTKLIITSFKYGEKEFIIDKEDLEKVKKYHWTIRKIYNNFYAYSGFWNKKAISLHRYIMNCPDGLVIDHINRNTLDNTKKNLRICNNLVNLKNRPLGNSGYRGIIQNKYGKYRVRLQIEKNKFDKTFKKLEDAINYRKELENKYHKNKEVICDIA